MREALRAFCSGLTKYLAGTAGDAFGFDIVKVEEVEAPRVFSVVDTGATVIEVMYRVPWQFTQNQTSLKVTRARIIVQLVDVEEII